MNLTLEHVTGGYGSRTVVDDVSFTLHHGEVVCLLGANGCGKTTLFKLILCLLRPSHGCVRLG
jgi:iron complex transport system ATP-binding protein